MLYIENCPQIAVERGTHQLPSHHSILVQITDPGSDFVTPKFDDYAAIHRFKFYDVTEPLYCRGLIEPITQDQADELVEILLNAMECRYNVIVHCAAGICRSGAVTEVGEIIGFVPVHNNRVPNVEVKNKMLKKLREYWLKNV